MAQINLNIPLILDGKSKEFVLYLNELRRSHTAVSICQSLIKAVDDEYLPPSIFSIFLSWSSCHSSIALCIHHGSSRFIRGSGIKNFGKLLASPKQWESMWREVGGAKGLIDLFEKSSVAEVVAFAKAIGSCNRSRHRSEARERAIEELLHALLPSYYPGSVFHSNDKRPIKHLYARMVSGCSAKFVEKLLDAKDQSNPLYQHVPAYRLIKTHGELLKKRVFEGIFGSGKVDSHIQQYMEVFVYRQELPASMEFATKVLKSRLVDIDNDKRWPSGVSEADVLFSLLKRSLKKKLPEAELRDVIMLGLQILEAKPTLKSRFQSGGIWLILCTRWNKAPAIYQDFLSLALRLELGGSQKTIGQSFLSTSIAIRARPELKWPLLRLYCLHVPKKGVDLDTADDFTPLAQQQWPSDVFYQLSRNQAVSLLNGLRRVNQAYHFLQKPARTSILSNQSIMSQKNFNVVLFLTLLQQDSEEIQIRTKSAVDELRQKSATAREQTDRAKLAVAASAFAIASGSLDLYGETITWQQRFVRDPLSVKVIFGREAVMTTEGIELLSGIPNPLPQDITLAELAVRVEKANKILKTFHAIMLVAKQEPSFHNPDWSSVRSLFGAAIKCRVDRAGQLARHLRDPQADLYTAIWGGTLTMLGEVDASFLDAAYVPIMSLFKKLPPTSLAATSKAMLKAGDEARSKQDRQPGDDKLERMSYEVLLQLTKSEKPELAQQFVLRTILDRPDASSWHRRFLSISFLKSLSAKDAHQMLLTFATAIGEKLEEQSYVKVGESQPAPSAPPVSLVKVTTVKYLAQLLDNASFISAEAAVEVLVELFKAGTHRDIRLATLDSLLSLLNNMCSSADANWRSNALVDIIMEALETVIPVVGSINERRPPREVDWVEAKTTGTLPEISDISGGLPPLLNAILIAPNSRPYPSLKNLRAEFATRFLIPILSLSQMEHRKWIALFLAKHKVNLRVDDLPPTPITPQVWDILVQKYPELLPESILNDFNKYIVTTIAPSRTLREFNESLRKNIDLQNSPEVQHWLSLFGQSMHHYHNSGTEKLVAMVRHGNAIPLVRNGITFEKVSEMIIAHGSLFLDAYTNYTKVWSAFVQDLRPPTQLTCLGEQQEIICSKHLAWNKTGRVILDKVTGLVIDKRAKYARSDNRSILPSTTKLRLWLLPYPCFPNTTEVDNQCKTFAKDMEELLTEFLTPEGSALRWPKIAEDALTVSKMLNTAEERLRVALYIGKLTVALDGAADQRLLAMNFVRIAVAMKLIEDGREFLNKLDKGSPSETLRNNIVVMIEEWQDHFDEAIREKAADWRREQTSLFRTLASTD